MRTHEQTVHDQFDSQALAYLNSAVHANGPDLARAQALVAQGAPATGAMLDVGCGAGHLSFALASSLARVVALDSSRQMLTAVANTATARGLAQIETSLGSAESLPFGDSTFRLVGTRYSAHHWRHLEASLRQIWRVLEPGGYLLVIDVMGYEDHLVDVHLQTLELLRDPSHVRNRSVMQWRALLDAAGFSQIEQAQWPLRLEFLPWIERMRTPAARVAVIRGLQMEAPQEVQEALAFEPDGSFTVQTGLFWTQKAV